MKRAKWSTSLVVEESKGARLQEGGEGESGKKVLDSGGTHKRSCCMVQ